MGLRSRWLWVGVAVAVAAWAPVLYWQAAHGWPQLTLAREIRAEYGTPGQRVGFFALQLVLFSLGATYLWVTGVASLWRDDAWRAYRVLAWAWLVALAVLILTAGQGYYPAGIYPVLIAAGAVVAERRGRRWWWALGAVLVSAAHILPATVPVLSARTLDASIWSGLGENLRETAGWQPLVDEVAAAYRSVPGQARARAGIFTSNYGEAGAVDRYGPSRGLPHAWSGQNGYGLWGPPPAGVAPVVVVWVVVVWEDGALSAYFFGRTLFRRLVGPVSNEETQRTAVFRCTGVIGGWHAAWLKLRHLSS